VLDQSLNFSRSPNYLAQDLLDVLLAAEIRGVILHQFINYIGNYMAGCRKVIVWISSACSFETFPEAFDLDAANSPGFPYLFTLQGCLPFSGK
jgi:hypothetical protein